MALDQLQKAYLDRCFPGLVEAISALAPGEFEADRPTLRVHGSAHLEGIVQAVNYLTDDGHRIAIKVSFSLKASAPLWNPKTQRFTRDHWDLYHYALHYGTAARDTIFRYDLDKTHQHHVHIPPNTDAHVPCADVEPDVTDLDPRGFIEMVASFRKDKKQPVTRKHRPSRSRKKTP